MNQRVKPDNRQPNKAVGHMMPTIIHYGFEACLAWDVDFDRSEKGSMR
jgi:hypothetical protein